VRSIKGLEKHLSELFPAGDINIENKTKSHIEPVKSAGV